MCSEGFVPKNKTKQGSEGFLLKNKTKQNKTEQKQKQNSTLNWVYLKDGK